MILNKEIYWNIMDYIFLNNHFIENPTNPQEVIVLEQPEEGKGVWLKDIISKFENEKCPREAILSVYHTPEMRDIIRANYAAAFKDYRILDLTSKGYDEYLKYKGIV